MKNPFLQDRNIFTKVAKPVAKSSQKKQSTQKESQPITSNNYASNNNKYVSSLGQPPLNATYSKDQFPQGSSKITNKYENKRQIPSQTIQSLNQRAGINDNHANKYLSSQKITFGDPMSSENAERTSGYFNVNIGSGLGNTGFTQGKMEYGEKKYGNSVGVWENKHGGTIGSSNGYSGSYGISNKNKNDSYGNDFGDNVGNIGRYETSYNRSNRAQGYGIGDKYESQAKKYEPYENGTSKYQQYSNNPHTTTNALVQQFSPPPINTFPSNPNSYTIPYRQFSSPPKQLPITPKNDISYHFRKEQNYTQELSPIGEVSRHRISEDEIVNFDGLMEGVELERLLKESKTQDQLMRILGMDLGVKRNNVTGDKLRQGQGVNNALGDYARGYSGNNQSNNDYRSSYVNNNIIKYNQTSNTNIPQHFHFQPQPQILNYAETSMQSQSNYPKTPAIAQNKTSVKQPYQSNNQQEQDFEQRFNKEMTKLIAQEQGSIGKDKRVFLTANEKIITKKYELLPL